MNGPNFLVRVALGVGLARRTAPATRMQSVNDAPAPDSAAQQRRGQAAQPSARPQPPLATQPQQPAPASHPRQAPAQRTVLKPAQPPADGLPARASQSDIGTVMPAAAQLNGDLEIEESIVLQCVVRGNVTQVGDHQVVLSATGGIHGTLRAQTAVIGGTVEGDVFADRIVVLETGLIHGNVEYTTLAMKEGATVNGVLTRIVPNVVGAADGTSSEKLRGDAPGLRAVSAAGQERVA